MISGGLTVPHATKLILGTTNLAAGWVDHALGKIPIWLEHGPLPKVPRGVLYMTPEGVEAFDASVWICLAEVRDIFRLKPHHGEKDEWLACGKISRSMVEARVISYDLRLHIQPVLERRSSIRSISSEEQERHVKEQIARNRASREDLRAKLAVKQQGREITNPLLKQATENSQVWCLPRACEEATDIVRKARKGTEREMVVETPQDVKLNRRVSLPSPLSRSRSIHEDENRYASVRSPKLRQALERNRAQKSKEVLVETEALTPAQNSADRINELIERFSRLGSSRSIYSSEFDSTNAGEGPSSRRKVQRKTSVAEDPFDQTFDSPPTKNLLPLGPQQSPQLCPFITEAEAHSERLRRARAGKKKASFDSESRVEGHRKPASRMQMRSIASVVEELARGSLACIAEDPEEESSFEDKEPEITDADPPHEAGARRASTVKRAGSSAKGKMPAVSAGGRSASGGGHAESEPVRTDRPLSKFFQDLERDREEGRPRYVKVKPGDVGW